MLFDIGLTRVFAYIIQIGLSTLKIVYHRLFRNQFLFNIFHKFKLIFRILRVDDSIRNNNVWTGHHKSRRKIHIKSREGDVFEGSAIFGYGKRGKKGGGKTLIWERISHF